MKLNPALTVSVELANILTLDQGKAWLGFTANSGGAAWENHDIISWSYQDEIASVAEPSSVFGLLAIGAIGAGAILKRLQQHKVLDDSRS